MPDTQIAASNASAVYEDTSTFTFDGYKSHAWVSDKFNGSHGRQIKGEVLTFTAEQMHKEGGLDVGFSKPGLKPMPVASVPDKTSICSSYDIDLLGGGRWWAGPKISVNWQGEESAKQNGDDWYENYIIEIASTSPEELHEILTDDYFSPEILPDIVLAGATYRTYKIRFHDWWQFWSVRQDYRETGTLPINPILNLWSEHGLPKNRQFDGVKANIETYGEVVGTGRMAVDVKTNPAKKLDCAL
ncbi:MAG: hypothetical protein ABJO36_04170 [Litorimonas sp.]